MDRLRIREVELSISDAIAAIMMPGIRDGRTYAWQSVDALVMVRSLI